MQGCVSARIILQKPGVDLFTLLQESIVHNIF